MIKIKRYVFSVGLFVFFVCHPFNQLRADDHEKAVFSKAPEKTNYLKNVRSLSIILRNNLISLFAPDQPRYSLTRSIVNANNITEVANLFSYAYYLREVAANEEKYGPLKKKRDERGHRIKPTKEQLRARAEFLSGNMKVVFKKDLSEVAVYTRKANKKIGMLADAVHSRLAEQHHHETDNIKFKKKHALLYLKLIEKSGVFDEKGPKYRKIYPKTGAVREFYVFTWVNVTKKKLAKAIANDYFGLMKQMGEEMLLASDIHEDIDGENHDACNDPKEEAPAKPSRPQTPPSTETSSPSGGSNETGEADSGPTTPPSEPQTDNQPSSDSSNVPNPDDIPMP